MGESRSFGLWKRGQSGKAQAVRRLGPPLLLVCCLGYAAACDGPSDDDGLPKVGGPISEYPSQNADAAVGPGSGIVGTGDMGGRGTSTPGNASGGATGGVAGPGPVTGPSGGTVYDAGTVPPPWITGDASAAARDASAGPADAGTDADAGDASPDAGADDAGDCATGDASAPLR